MSKYRVSVTVELDYTTNSPLVDPEFFFGEHLCVGDVLDEVIILHERADAMGTCLCHISELKYLGEVKE